MTYIVIPYILPEYRDGLTAMAIMFACGFVLPVGLSFGDLFNVIGRQRIYLRNMTAGFIVNLVTGAALLVIAGWGLEGVALGALAGITAFSLLQFAAYRSLLRESAADQAPAEA